MLKKSLDEDTTGLLTILGKPGWDGPFLISTFKVIKFGNSPYYLE